MNFHLLEDCELLVFVLLVLKYVLFIPELKNCRGIISNKFIRRLGDGLLGKELAPQA